MNSIPRDEIVSFFKKHFLRVTYNNKEIQCSCPLCGDSRIDPERKRRFHYNFEKDQWHCFNCGKGWKANGFRELVKRFGNQNEKIKYYIPYLKNTQIKLNVKEKEIDLNEIYNQFKQTVVPDNKLTTRDLIILHQFRTKKYIPYFYPLYIGKDKFKDYIIIPVYNYGNIVWWCGRRIDEFNKFKPKYKNSEYKFRIQGFPFLHKCKFRKDQPIVITESILDGIVSNEPNITSIAGIPSYKYIIELLKYTDVGVIIALDQDKSGFYGAYKLLKHFRLNNKVKFFLFPKFNKYGKDFIEYIDNKLIYPETMYEFILNYTFKSNLKYEVELKKCIKYVS